MRALQLILLCAVPLTVWGTVLRQRAAEEMATSADHVLVGRIVEAELVPSDEKAVDSHGQIGPFVPVILRLRVEFTPTGILKSTTNSVPKELLFRYSTESYSARNVHKMLIGTSQIFFLTGPEYLPLVPWRFYEPVSKRRAVEKALGIPRTNSGSEMLRTDGSNRAKEKPIVEYGSRAAYDDRGALLEYQKRKAAEGDAEALLAMGMRFLNGIDVEQNERLARDFLEQASRNGNLRAREKLRQLRK